ncbi:TIGR02677 family protein [Shouchella shacheensis]|uniref:TIGR02677 family protein n=1 Tax=Shouchella shacheensis TaxID=1649580 RepID=UPI0007401582|nr:TIGR02677 family protein [Shouchella shacheensis]
MSEQTFKKVLEATYLSTDKTPKYRAILRFFYQEHERLREFLMPEEVLEHLHQYEEFREYDLEELQTDLSSLVKWRNLIAHQESGKVQTIEEFKKKRFRYQVTPYTVEFERMLVQFETNSEQFSGSLEKTQFERFYEILEKISGEEKRAEESAQLWDDLLTYFKKITQNTSDYFAYLRSEDATEQMKSDAFFHYKDQFTMYLREFILHLQRTAAGIQDVMISLDRKKMRAFFTKVTEHEEQVFRFEKTFTREEMVEELEATWLNVKAWFLGNGSGESQYENVLLQTNEAIRKMTRIIQRLGERSQIQHSRKDDYVHLAKWFLSFDKLQDAHKLSSVVFGLKHTKHLYSDHLPTDDIYVDVWEEEAMVHERMPITRSYREKTRTSASEDKEAEKEKTIEDYLQKLAHETALIHQYLDGESIDLEKVPEVEPFVRKTFLLWIGKAMAKKDQEIKTEFGDRVYVELDQARSIHLKAKDGTLEMPAARFHFLDKGGKKSE